MKHSFLFGQKKFQVYVSALCYGIQTEKKIILIFRLESAKIMRHHLALFALICIPTENSILIQNPPNLYVKKKNSFSDREIYLFGVNVL